MAETPLPASGIASRPPHLMTLVAISSLSPLAINIVVPALPAMQGVFATDYPTIQLALSLYLAMFAAGQLIMGPLSDRFGRRPIIIAGLVLFVAGSVMCLASRSVEMLLAGRLLQALGGSAGLSLARAVVRDISERDRAAAMIGYMTMGLAIAQTIGPPIGGLIYERFDWTAIFWLLAGLGVLTLLATVIDLSETNRHRGGELNVGRIVGSWSALLRLKAFTLPTATAAAASGIFFAFMGGAPYLAATLYGLSPAIYGLYFVLVSIGYAIGNFGSGRYATQLGTLRMISIGNWLGVLGTSLMIVALLTGASHPIVLFGPMLILSIANGVTLPSAVAEAVSARPDLAGAAAGLSGALQIGVGALASALVGALVSGGLWPMALIMFGFSLLALALGVSSNRYFRRVRSADNAA